MTAEHRNQQRSPFRRVLAILTLEERARAHRLRAVLNLREEDAIWELCGIAKGFDQALREIPTKCSEAAEQAARWEFVPQGSDAAAPNAEAAATAAANTLLTVTRAWMFVVTLVLVGSTCFTVGAILQHGSADWAPGDIRARGVVPYVLSAIWTAPIAGRFALLALALLAVGAMAVRFCRSN